METALMQTIKDWAGLFNVLLLPMVIYIVRIENMLARTMTRLRAHEETDTDKFAAIFRRLEYLERQHGRRLGDDTTGG